MSAYVDAARHRFGRMRMCHLMADTPAELLAVVDAIGIQRKWIQKAGQPDEHFDICASKRAAALEKGLVVEVDSRALVGIVQGKRRAKLSPRPGGSIDRPMRAEEPTARPHE